jgi:hypothetical protein
VARATLPTTSHGPPPARCDGADKNAVALRKKKKPRGGEK